MNYLTLFKETDLQDGGDNFCCRIYRDGGPTHLICRSDYPMLFVLQGSVEMQFKYSSCRIEAGNLVVIEKQTLTNFRPAPQTIVLLLAPARRLRDFLILCSKTYDSSFSETVRILPPLQAWIDSLLSEHLRGVSWEGKAAHEQRKELAHIFMAYPPRELGELRAAFTACVLGDCEKCQEGVFATAAAGAAEQRNTGN